MGIAMQSKTKCALNG